LWEGPKGPDGEGLTRWEQSTRAYKRGSGLLPYGELGGLQNLGFLRGKGGGEGSLLGNSSPPCEVKKSKGTSNITEGERESSERGDSCLGRFRKKGKRLQGPGVSERDGIGGWRK